VSNFTSDQGAVTGTEIWQNALANLEQRIKPHNFDMWLRPIECCDVTGSRITLRAPNRYIKEWFEDNYLSIVLQEIRNATRQEFQVSFELDEVNTPELPPEPVVAERPPSGWDYGLNERYTFDSFVVGPSNQLAHAAARAVTELPAGKYNPLFIYGGVGLGKTHLLCAIGHEVRRREPTVRIAYLSSERFMNEYINFLRSNRIEEFRTKFRELCDILLMDDIQFIAGKDRTQDEFFHTFNSLYDTHRQIVVTSDKYPHEIPDLEERLRTRFQWGLIADIQQPELETRVAILKKKAEAEHITLPDDVALYLATNIKSNVRELEGSLIRLAAFASLQRAEVTVEFARDSLKQFLSQSATSLTIETIQKEVAAYHNIKVSDLKSPKRHKNVARPRQIAMYLCRKLTGSSFPEIGQRFGGKDHSTVISACRKIEELMDRDLTVRTAVETLERQLQL
jgi:chromosomal replication initiator protein